MKSTTRTSSTPKQLLRNTPGATRLDGLLDEAYLLILTRRPSASTLARALQVPKTTVDRALRQLCSELKPLGLRVGSAGTGKKRTLQIEALGERRGKPVAIGPEALAVRRMPRQRPGLKLEDEIIHARDW
jgi:hypothetical protein